jgi:hypothetical protein
LDTTQVKDMHITVSVPIVLCFAISLMSMVGMFVNLWNAEWENAARFFVLTESFSKFPSVIYKFPTTGTALALFVGITCYLLW